MRMPASARGLTDGHGAAGHHRHEAKVNDHTALPEVLDARIAVAPPRLERPGQWVDAVYDNQATEAVIAAADYAPYIRRVGEARPPHDPRVEPRRWPVERTHAWYNYFRRILIRWEKKVESWLALIHFANALIAFRACYW
jgi:putative transposase